MDVKKTDFTIIIGRIESRIWKNISKMKTEIFGSKKEIRDPDSQKKTQRVHHTRIGKTDHPGTIQNDE